MWGGRGTLRPPALGAKQAANIDHIARGRLSLNVVSAWWADEARQYGAAFDEHDARYARTAEWLAVVSGMWAEPCFSFHGRYYDVQDAVCEPKPLRRPRPPLYAGGESPAGEDLIARACGAHGKHGEPPQSPPPTPPPIPPRPQTHLAPPPPSSAAAH